MFDIKRVNHKLVEAIPTLVRQVHTYMPKYLQRGVLTIAFNQFFQPELASNSMDFLKQKHVIIEISDWQLSFGLTLNANNKLAVTIPVSQQDLLIRASSHDFIHLIGGEVDPDTLFFRRRLIMLGDTELGLYCKNLLDTIELSRLPKPLPMIMLQIQKLITESACTK